jgi:ATP-dependent DNA helicase RecG
VLKQRSEWIDRKFINYPSTLNADPGVEIVVEPMTKLQALVAGGEGPTVEFKCIVPERDTDARKKVCATVAAFANGDGGHILFGVTDDGAIVGLSGVDIQKACDTVVQFVSSTVTPVPHFRVARVSGEGNDGSALEVIVLTVDQGDQPPYGIDPAHPKYYVRRGATTFEASSAEVRALARSRPPADQAYQLPYGTALSLGRTVPAVGPSV